MTKPVIVVSRTSAPGGPPTTAADRDGIPEQSQTQATRTVSVVLPARNEERNIGRVLSALPPSVDEVVVVDGYSSDGTVQVASQVRPDVVILRQRGTGKGSAMRTGFERASGDFIVVLDADGSMDPAEIEYFVTALDDGYEFVKGSRHLPGAGSLDLTATRTLGNRGLTTAVNLLWGVPFTDLCYGYLAFQRRCLPELALTRPGFEIETEMCIHAVRAGLRIAEVPSVELARQHGQSSLHPMRDGTRILHTMLLERFAPRRRHLIVDALDRRALIPEAQFVGTRPTLLEAVDTA